MCISAKILHLHKHMVAILFSISFCVVVLTVYCFVGVHVGGHFIMEGAGHFISGTTTSSAPLASKEMSRHEYSFSQLSILDSPVFQAEEMNEVSRKSTVSVEDVKHLPLKPTVVDVLKLSSGFTVTDSFFFTCPSSDGGLYFFSFFFTNEIPLPDDNEDWDTPILVAVVRFPSKEAYKKLEDGRYVYPEHLMGVRFSGLCSYHNSNINP